MANKKNKKVNHINGDAVLENTNVANDSEVVVAEAEENKTAKVDVKEQNKKDKSKKVKKEKKENKLKRKFKETGSELKKVTWPTFKQTVKKTGVVLGIVIFFGVILFAIDYILSVSLKALAGEAVTAVEMWVTIGILCAIVVGIIAGIVVWAVKRKNRR